MFAREESLSEIINDAELYHNLTYGDLTIEEVNIRTDIEIANRSSSIYLCDKYKDKIKKKHPGYAAHLHKYTWSIRHTYYAPGFFIRQRNRVFNCHVVRGTQLNTLEGIQLCEHKIKEYDFDPVVFRYINDVFGTCNIKAKHKYNQLFILHNLGLI